MQGCTTYVVDIQIVITMAQLALERHYDESYSGLRSRATVVIPCPLCVIDAIHAANRSRKMGQI